MRLARAAKVTAADSGEHIWFNRSLLTIKVTSADTNNVYDLVEVTGQGGNSTPLHVDPTCETFRILEGELLFHIAGKEVRTSAGDLSDFHKGFLMPYR